MPWSQEVELINVLLTVLFGGGILLNATCSTQQAVARTVVMSRPQQQQECGSTGSLHQVLCGWVQLVMGVVPDAL